MLIIKKTGEGYYLANLANKYEILGRNECHKIKNELKEIVKPHREISLDIKGVKNIDMAGLKILFELKTIAENKKCKVRYINMEHKLAMDFTGFQSK